MAVRCLIVDDDDRFLQVARDLLERERIAVVGLASDSAGALRLMDEHRPDVMLIDVNLGDESGFDLVDSIAGTDPARQPVLILISTYSHEDYGDFPSAGATAFIRKSELSGMTIREIVVSADQEHR
jgi:DNA-binding NarL/FixJ family response regulator